MKTAAYVLMFAVTVMLGGCLVGTHPFYDASEVSPDIDITGKYRVDDDPTSYVVTAEGLPGTWQLEITDAHGSSRYRVVTY
jgi:hypothetical protein